MHRYIGDMKRLIEADHLTDSERLARLEELCQEIVADAKSVYLEELFE